MPPVVQRYPSPRRFDEQSLLMPNMTMAVRKPLDESMAVSHFLVNITPCHHHHVGDFDEIIGAPKMRTGAQARAGYEARIWLPISTRSDPH
ncbi:hypothetical protein VNO77_01951 [Canavalia gladiata]|uniref:Uncharacterized protein n=1 Tax=Canavalia gladiata TaxID=3824 RepID=A0AAN9MX86_CANGL